MPTLSETMTLVVFSARVTAGTLNIGQIYSISDKGWVLQAHTNTIAKPLHDFKINNGDSLPEGINPDQLVIDTGLLTDSDTTVNLTVPNNYYPVSAIVEDSQGMDDLISIGYPGGGVVLSATLEATPKTKIMYPISTSSNLHILNSLLSIVLPSGLVGRVCIRFVKFT